MTSFLRKLRRSLGRGSIYLLPLALLLVAVVARLAVPDMLGRLSLICFDLYQRAAPRDPGDQPVQVVDINNRSLKRLGQWPWSRTIVAQLVDKLRDAGAAVVALDIVFSEPDRTSPKMLLALAKGGTDSEEAKRLLSIFPDPDRVLAEAIGSTPVVTGFILSQDSGTGTPEAKAGFAFTAAPGADPLQYVASYSDAIGDLPELEAASAGNGFLNDDLDYDNVVRRVPLILKLADTPQPSFVAEILRVALGAHNYLGQGAGANARQGFGEATGLSAVRIGGLTVPTDDDGRVWVHYALPRYDRYLSASDILDGKFDPTRIADHIVLIGTSAKGVVNDRQATPVARGVPGVEIHAQLIGQILQGTFLTRPDWAVGPELLFAVLGGLLLIFTLSRIGALASAAIGAAVIAAGIAASWLAFRNAQLLIDPVYPVAVIASVYLLSSLLGYLRTETRQREIRGAFSRYMSPHLVDELARHPERLVLGGEARIVTIMFADVRGFTALAEGLDSQTLTQLMNRLLSPMTEIITEHKGTIDKYIGDCIMAFWNAPLDDPEHARNAVRAAQAMLHQLIGLNRTWEAEALAAGREFKEIRLGIGINTGECTVGNFGSMQRFDYSLLGDPVNLAARLEGLGKVYGVDLVFGEDTAAYLEDLTLLELDLVAVKGKTRAVRVFTLPVVDEAEKIGAGHSTLLTAYRHQDWAVALGVLDNSELKASPHLAPVYDLYRRRIAHYQLEAPPAGWDGVYTAEDK